MHTHARQLSTCILEVSRMTTEAKPRAPPACLHAAMCSSSMSAATNLAVVDQRLGPTDVSNLARVGKENSLDRQTYEDFSRAVVSYR